MILYEAMKLIGFALNFFQNVSLTDQWWSIFAVFFEKFFSKCTMNGTFSVVSAGKFSKIVVF